MAHRGIDVRRPAHLLERILETPDLARVVRELDPALLHRIVRKVGLEDAGPIVALATPDQLTRLFDADVWRGEAGAAERFDAERFGLWLEVLVEVGADVAARRLIELDFDFVTAALSQLVLVLQPDPIDPELEYLIVPEDPDAASFDIGGYHVVARRAEAWDALVALLTTLEADHGAYFGRLMQRCFRFSIESIDDNGLLYDVMSSEQQTLDDATSVREERRDEEGYVSPPRAVAFLQLAREPVVDAAGPPARDHVTSAYFEEMERRAAAIGEPRPADPSRAADVAAPDTEDRPVAAFLETLREAGVLRDAPRALLPAPAPDAVDRLSRVRRYLLETAEQDAALHARRTAELAYLANVLVAGCSFQSRRFTKGEAAEAVLATCNLGLENWPSRWPVTDLVAAFRVGWSVLHERVVMHAARRLVEVLSTAAFDEPFREPLAELGALMSSALKAGTPWREREGLDALAVLDPPTWATLLGLVDECPVVPRTSDAHERRPALRVSAEFEFISLNVQVDRARAFVASLEDRLSG